MTDPIVYQFQATGADKVISSIKSINAENELMARFLRELQQAFGLSEKSAQGYAKSLGITGSTLKSYQQAQAEAAKSANTLANEQQKTTKAIQGTDEAAKALAKQFVASAGARATTFLKDTATDALDAARRFNGLNAALLTVSGSQEAAGENFKFIRGEVNRLGLDLEKATGGFNKLVASTKDVALSKELFTGINEAASALQLSADDTNGVIIALTQIASKGVVSMEELRQQLGERLPGAFSLAAKSVGLTEAEFVKLVSTGEVKAIPFLKKFAPALKDAFGEGAARNANSLNAQFNRLNTALFELASTVGNAIAPAFKLVADGVISLTAFFKGLPEPIQQAIILFTGLSIGLVAVAGAIAAFSLAAGVVVPILGTIAGGVGAASLALAGLPAVATGASVSLGVFAVAAGTALLAVTALVAAVAATKFIVGVLNFDKNLENFEELQRGAQSFGNSIAELSERSKSQIKVFDDLAKSGKDASKEQKATASALIAANNEAIKSADARIAALQSQIGQEERLDNSIRIAIAGEEIQRKALKNKNEELVKTVASVKVAVDSLDKLTDAYKRTNAQIDASSADRQASILERVRDEEEANKQILADDIATNRQRLEETEKLISQLRIRSQSLSGSKDSKDVENRSKIEDQITALISKASKERVDIAKGQAEQRKAIEQKLLEDLDIANKKALDAIDQSVKFRIDAAKRASVGNIKAKEEEAVTVARIEREAADQRLALVVEEQSKLQALKGQISGKEFRDREVALAKEQSDAILAIAQNETALLAAEQEKRVADIQTSFDNLKVSIESQKISLQFDAEGLQLQEELLNSQLGLVDAISSAKQASFAIELENINQAATLQKQLSDTAINDVNTRAEIQRQLNSLGVAGATTDLEFIRKKQAVQTKVFAEERASLAQRQAIELKIFDVKASQQKIAAQIAIAEKQLQVIESQRLVQTLIAQEADKQRIAAAREAVVIAQSGVALAQQSAAQLNETLAVEREILGIKQSQETATLAKTQAEKANTLALEKAKALDSQANTSAQQLANTTKQVATNMQDAANSSKKLAETLLGDATVGAVTLRDELGNIIGILGEARTEDPNKLLKEQLDLKLKIAKTDVEKAKIQAEIDKLSIDTSTKELADLEKKIKLNNEILAQLDQFKARAAISGFDGRGGGVGNATFFANINNGRLNFDPINAVQGRFTGGDVPAGQPTIVGEDPNTGAILPSSELFVPNVSGYVMAASKFQALLSQGVPSKGVMQSSVVRSPQHDYLKTISGDIKTLNQKVGQLQPTIEQVNINSDGVAPDDMVYKLLSAQIRARR